MSRQTTLNLPAGKILTVTADAFSAGSVRRLAQSGDTTTNYAPSAVAVSSSVTLGPFMNDRQYAVVTDSGNALTSAVTTPESTFATSTDVAAAAAAAILTPRTVTDYAVDGAVAIAEGIVTFSKAGVLAATLAAPSAGQAGTQMRFTSRSANAHTITATGLLQDGVTGGGKDTATFAAFVGASITLVAINLKWHVLSSNNVTVA